MKTTIIAFLLTSVLGDFARAADPSVTTPPANEVQVMEERWQAIQPDLFAGNGKRHVGAKIRFTTMVFGNVKADSPIFLPLKGGVTIQASNVSKQHRIDIATPHKPPTFVTMEAIITSINATKRIVSLKATRVEVTW
jgi:hypothetical protein